MAYIVTTPSILSLTKWDHYRIKHSDAFLSFFIQYDFVIITLYDVSLNPVKWENMKPYNITIINRECFINFVLHFLCISNIHKAVDGWPLIAESAWLAVWKVQRSAGIKETILHQARKYGRQF